MGVPFNKVAGALVNGEAKLGNQSHSPQKTNRVVLEGVVGNSPDGGRGQVGKAIEGVYQLFFNPLFCNPTAFLPY